MMVRAMRSRKPHPKYPSEQYELSASPKKSPVKKIVTKTEAAASKGLRSGLTKGNLNSGSRTLTGTRTVVLRDRTNLHEEPLKVDVLIKQGTRPGVASKSTKSTKATRGGGSKTLGGNAQEETEKTSSVGGTRKKRKLEHDGEEKSLEDLKSRKKNRTDAEKIVEPAKVTKRVTRAVEKSVAAPKSGKIEPEIMKKSTAARKTVSKEEKDEGPEGKVASPAFEKPEPSPGITRSSSSRNAEQPAAKTTRKIVKSTENDEKSVKPKVTRKTTRQGVAAKESLVDSGLGARQIAENEENPEPEMKTTISKEPDERASRRESRVKIDKVLPKNSVGEKKFFKTKPAERKIEKRSPMKKTVTAKRRNIGTARLSVSFRSRQATLQESFAKQIPRKVLRPRKSRQNYCEETMVEKKSDAKTGNDEPKKTGPVYKSVKPEDDSSNDKNAVYDFKFDSNDSQEKLPTKKRKRNLRKNIVTKKATGPKKTTKTTSGKAEIQKIDKVERVSIESKKPPEFQAPEMDNFPEGINDLPLESEKIVEQEKKLERMEKVPTPAKPRVVDSIELKGNDCLTLTTTPVLAKSSETKARNYLRPPKQFRTMLGHALLNKSISPITKAIENFDPGSPWRPPVFQDFSRVKNIVQSTPQVRDFTAILQRVPEKIAPAESKKIDVPEKKNEPEMTKISNQPLAKSPRKFGTEISPPNGDQIVASRLPDSAKENSRENEKKIEKIEPATIQDLKSTSTSIESRLSSPSSDHFGADTMNFSPGDKENSLPVISSSKRSPLKSLNRTPFGNLNNSPLKNLNRSPLKNLQNSPSKNLQRSPLKNLQNSPSKNLQKSPLKDPKKILEMLRAKKMQNPVVEDDSRVLRQSNLDNFLNLDEMPQSTRINTLHGIFDDAHSTPISGKPAKKTSKDFNVEDAFGFDVSDEDSEAEISPIKKSIEDVPAGKKGLTKIDEKSKIAVPARLSIGDIKKHLLPMRKKDIVDQEAAAIERIEEEDEAKEKSPEKAKKSKITRVEKIPDPVDFSDTFDLHEKSENVEDNTTLKFELFADIEPQHFKQVKKKFKKLP